MGERPIDVQVILLLLALVVAVAPVTAQDDASENLVLIAAMAAAGADCEACSTAGPVVCAELPNAPGVKQTVMSRCIATCQGFKGINDGACVIPGGEAGTASTGGSDRLYAKIPPFRDPNQGPCSPSKDDIFKYARQGHVFMGCVESAGGEALVGTAGAASSRAPTQSPADFKVKASDLITKPTEQFVLMQHRLEAGSHYYIKATKTTWEALAGTLKSRTATFTFPRSKKTNPLAGGKSATVSAQDASDVVALQAVVEESASVAPAEVIVNDAVDDVAGSGRRHKHRRSLLLTDNRYQVTNTKQYPYWNIGQLLYSKSDGNYLCSGTFMSPDDVITAGHCVVDSSTGIPHFNFQFTPGRNGADAPYGSYSERGVTWFSVWVGGSYTGSDGSSPKGSAYFDSALIYTAKPSPIWNDIGGYSCGAMTRWMRSCGYPLNKGGSTMWCSDGYMAANDLCDSTKDALKSTSIFLSGGMSGGPVFTYTVTGPVISNAKIGGVNSGGSSYQTLFAPFDQQTSSLYRTTASIWSSTYSFLTANDKIQGAVDDMKARVSVLFCLSVGNLVAGAEAQFTRCNSGMPQLWQSGVPVNFELRNAGLCLAVLNDNFSGTPGTPIILTKCVNSRKHWWFYDMRGRLRPYKAPGKCLDAPRDGQYQPGYGWSMDGGVLYFGQLLLKDCIEPTPRSQVFF